MGPSESFRRLRKKKIKMKKGQTSVEGIFVIGAVFLMFLFILGYGFNKRTDNQNAEKFVSQRDTCIKISNLITGAFINGNGTEIISNSEYEFDLLNNSRLIGIYSLKEKGFSSDYAEADVVFCSVPINQFPSRLVHAGEFKAKNVGDFVDVTYVI